MKYYSIEVDGIDKTGKDILERYIAYLGKFKYIVNVRGILSQIAYADLYKRDYAYDLQSEQNNIIVYLTADEADWSIRCKLTHEPKIDYTENITVFNNARDLLIKKGLTVLEYNTSKMTPYEIANCIINYMEKLNKEN